MAESTPGVIGRPSRFQAPAMPLIFGSILRQIVSSLAPFPGFAAFLAGGIATWPSLRLSAVELMSICDAEELSPLVHRRLMESACKDSWPPAIRERLSAQARVHTAEELLRGAETRAVLDALAGAGIRSILIKGTPLAYSIYDAPALRPRDDTDLLVADTDVEPARRVLASRGYVTSLQCSELFSQFDVQRVDALGTRHAFDVHWRISTQPVFAGVLTYDELLRRAVPVPLLGPAALAPCAVDALLLACVHPVMHHRNLERVLWIYDIHLLASTLSAEEFREFVERVQQKRMAAVCAHQLQLAHRTFNTSVPPGVTAALAGTRGAEPSAAYLASQRRWHDELIASVRGLPSAGARIRWLREVLFPPSRYMLGRYRLTGARFGRLLLPALYLHRNLRGGWNVLTGTK
jgi:hypothetical protein